MDDGRLLDDGIRPDAVGDEALQRGDCDRLVQLAASADALAGMGADPPANREERVRFGGDAIGLVEATLGDKSDVALSRRPGRAGRLAGRGAALVDRVERGDGIRERTRDRLPLGNSQLELARDGDRAGRGTVVAADAGLADEARAVT